MEILVLNEKSNEYPYLVAEVGSNHLGSDKLIKIDFISKKIWC